MVTPDAAAVENLLRLARSECGAALVFAALDGGHHGQQVFSVPGADEHTLVTRAALVELVRQASTDPELPHARVLVRAVDVGAPLTLVVAAAPAQPAEPAPPTARAAAPAGPAPRPGGSPQDVPGALIGLLFEAGHELDDARRELLAQLAKRLGRHARARHQVASLRETQPGGGAADVRAADVRAADVRAADMWAADIWGAGDGGGGGGATDGAEVGAFEEEPALAWDIFGPDPEEPAEEHPEALHERGVRRVGSATGPAGAAISPHLPAGRAPGGVGARGVRAKTRFDPFRSVPGEFDVAPGRAGGAGGMDAWWLLQDVVTGLPSVARFLSQVGRLLAAQSPTSSSLVLVLVEVPGERTAPVAARALSAQLRNADPLTRIDCDLFAAALLLSHGGARADAVEARLASAVRASLEWLSPVRTTHVVAGPGDRREVDELLRQAIAQLPGRAGAAEPPGGGRGAPLLGSPSPMVTS